MTIGPERQRGFVYRPAIIGGVVLALSLVAIPVLQAASGSWDSPLWVFLALGTPMIGIVLLVPLWVIARPAKRLLRQKQSDSPSSFVSLAARWEELIKAADLVVVIADNHGVALHNPRGESTVIDWEMISSISITPATAQRDSAVTLVDPEGQTRFVLTPMHSNGRNVLREWQIDEWVKQLRRARPAVM